VGWGHEEFEVVGVFGDGAGQHEIQEREVSLPRLGLRAPQTPTQVGFRGTQVWIWV
jgi:hypothetical protein